MSITRSLSISALSDGIFLFIFSIEEEKLRILEQGFWSLVGQLLALEPWHPDFRPTRKALKYVKI